MFSMETKNLTVLLLMTSSLVVITTKADVSFGDCLPGKETCSECYLTLKKALLGRDDNIQRLSNAFFPPRANIPEFVTVTYVFENTNESQIWYWTHDSSYLFFQFTTFQYLSLFFGKPADLFSQKLTLTLDQDCAATPNVTFRLLTQRVSCTIMVISMDLSQSILGNVVYSPEALINAIYNLEDKL